MALYTTRGVKNIPEGGVKLSREEALQYQKKIIKKWKSLSEVFFLEYGWAASSATTFASSFYITGLVRSLLNTGPHGRFIPYFVTTFVPSVISGFLTEKSVTERVLLMSTGCPMCMQFQFGVTQSVLSVFFPTMTSLALYLTVANSHNTIALPDISYDTRNAYKFCFNLLKSKAVKFQIVTALQIPLIFLLPYLQIKQLNTINEILRKETISELM